LTALTLSSVQPQLAAQSRHPVRRIIANHVERYPKMELADLYKLLHQAALGSEHAIENAASARTWLMREKNEMGTGPAEPMVDPLTPDTLLVRVHLRPYFVSGGDPNTLLRAFVGTANTFVGSPDTLRQYWSTARAMATEGLLPFPRAEMDTFFARMEADAFPAVHHSGAYEAAYRPAYRVVAASLLPPH
jgi:hypothetical protein